MSFNLLFKILRLVFGTIFLREHVENIATAWENVLLSINTMSDSNLFACLEFDTIYRLLIKIYILIHIVLITARKRCINFAIMFHCVNCSQTYRTHDMHLFLHILPLCEKYLRKIMYQIIIQFFLV